ncbi:MAG: NFACT RNA binding domain-containing protein [Ignavibacteriaceae bacterium]
MFNNYLILRKLINEFDTALKGLHLFEAFTQEKNQLVLSFRKPGKDLLPECHIVVNVNPVKPFLYSRETYFRAKKNSISFFTDYLPAKLINVDIADYERIIRFDFDLIKLYIIFHGPLSNIILIDNNRNILSFKNDTEENYNKLTAAVSASRFSLLLPGVEIPDGITRESLRNLKNPTLTELLPFFSKEIMTEISARDMKFDSAHINSLITEVLNYPLAAIKDELLNKIHLLPSSFTKLRESKFEKSDPDGIVLFDTVNDGIKYYLSNSSKLASFASLHRRLEKFISGTLHQLSDRLNQQKNRLSSPSREEEYEKIGNLLLININKIMKSDESVILEDIYNNGEPLTIPLKPLLTPQGNAEYYFNKGKGEKKSIEKSRKLYADNLTKYDRFLTASEKLSNANKYEELLEIKKEIGMEEKEYTTEENELTKKFRHYIIDGKYHVYVGKDSAANDLLTLRFAKPNDLWFHARGYAGSHTVLRVENTKEGIPKDIIKKAASIAAFYSKGKTSKLVPVSYTFKKYVSKRKGLEVGQVMLTREQVVMVPPLLPSGTDEN